MAKKIIKYLSSLRFTISLITLLGLMCLLGLWIPQKSLVKQWYFQWKTSSPGLVAFLDALQLTDIYTSPLMMALWVLFFLNLALVITQRIPVINKKIVLDEAKVVHPDKAGGYPYKLKFALPAGVDSSTVISYLRKKSYKVITVGDGFYGVKNRFSPVAFVLFHLSFFLILLGGLTSVYTSFYGYLEIAEGESFQGELARYVQVPPPSLPKLGTPPKVDFTVLSIVPAVSEFTETGLKVVLRDGRGKVYNLDINKPYFVDSSKFVLKNLGVVPLFVLKDRSGKEIDGAYVKLNVLKGLKDKFDMGGLQFQTKFYPDYLLYEGKHSTRTLEFKHPAFVISVLKGADKIGEGVLPLNGALNFDGYRLEFRDLRYWVRFSVIKDHGVGIVYAGFLLACLAVIWRLLFYRREIVGVFFEEDGAQYVKVAARSEYYKGLAEDEFNRLFDDISAKNRRVSV